jgi:signal transduction histidine kinase/CheY-like chemotaxis protein
VLGRWPTLLEAHRRAQAGKPGNATNEVDGLIFDAQCIPRFDEHGRVTGVIGVATDVTDRVQARREQEQLQAQLAQAQRLESIGKLAGGVAHDFNNLLTVVISCASFLGKRIPAGDPLREDVDEIMEAAERGSNLTRQLLAFGRRQPGAPRVLDLGEVVHDLHKLLQRTVGEQIELVLEDGDMRPHVRADLGQLEQVVMNLVVNARDALEQHGRIVVRTDQVTIRPGDQSVLDPLPAGEYARLTVRDNGPGISEDVASRAFEPFFTTKPRGQGTGLGLATVHGIVKQAAGQVDLRPTQGGGTIATVLLPAASDAVEPDLKPAVLAPASGGGERVLVVDDELSVAGAAERILSDHGYEVTKVTDPVSALDVLSSSPFDLLLSDVVMPQLSGGQLAERAASLRPELKVLFMTGYADAELLASCPADRLVQKPFSECDLVNRVRGALKAAA